MNLRRWQKRDPFTTSHLNEPVDAANTNLPVTGGPGILATTGAGGTVVQLSDDLWQAVTAIKAKITGQSLKSGGTMGRGFYSAVLLGASFGIDASQDVTEEMFGLAAASAGAVTVYVMNQAETDTEGTALPIPCLCWVKFVGNDDNDGTPVYSLIGDVPSEDGCSP